MPIKKKSSRVSDDELLAVAEAVGVVGPRSYVGSGANHHEYEPDEGHYCGYCGLPENNWRHDELP